MSLDAIDQVIHETTLVTNSLIERRGAHMAFITTERFRDVIAMRVENRFEQYDLNMQLPIPVVARQHRFTVAGGLVLPSIMAEQRHPRVVLQER